MLPTDNWENVQRILALVLALAVLVGASLFLTHWRAQVGAERTAVWREFALAHGLALRERPDGFGVVGELNASGRIGALDVELYTYPVKFGRTKRIWVRVQSRGPGPRGSFEVQRASWIAQAGLLLRPERASIDGGAFDRDFVTRSTPPSLAAEALDERARERFAGLTRAPRLSYSDGDCALDWRAGAESVEQLERAVELHALLRTSLARASQAS